MALEHQDFEKEFQTYIQSPEYRRMQNDRDKFLRQHVQQQQQKNKLECEQSRLQCELRRRQRKFQ